MSGDRPTRDDLARGTTVAVDQPDEDEGEPIIGDVRRIITDEHTTPGGITVELESGVTGRVLQTDPDEDERDVPQGGG